MELIETKTAGSGGVANFDFTAIPITYTDLLIKFSGRATVDESGVSLQFNNNTSTSNYIYTTLQGNGSTVTRSKETNLGFIGSRINPSTFTGSTFSNSEFYIPNYRNGNQKSVTIDSVNENNATLANSMFTAGVWNQTDAITSIKLYVAGGNLAEFSTASLYGISRVTSTPKATGGIVSQDASYWYHTFPFTSTFTPTEAITCDYLVVAGGGGTLGDRAGGGGGGGLRSTVTATGGGGTLESPLSLTAQAYTITVGAGGGAASQGGTSSIAGSGLTTISTVGGGAGPQAAGGNGGSGGGGYGVDGASGGTGTANQGRAGGNGVNLAAGGGGGASVAGTPGSTASSGSGGAGGNGVQITAFANVTQTGVNNGYYAGGGGGYGNGVGGSASLGGGGVGSVGATGAINTNGIVNTGGGAGGGHGSMQGFGGSGLVIVRYAK
jgi:hypothetical protein